MLHLIFLHSDHKGHTPVNYMLTERISDILREYGNIYLDVDNEDWCWRNPVLYPYSPIDTSQFKVIFKCGTITCYKKSDIIIYEMLGIADELIFKNGKFIEREHDTLCKELK